MLGVLLALTLSGPIDLRPECERVRCPRVRQVRPDTSGTSTPFFEFAPTSGTGMGTACACTTPTGSKGEAMTFSRASSGTCLRGNVSSSIANGDMTTCSSNQPRVMPGGDGSGALGVLVEGARTNYALRSEALDNAAWNSSPVGVSAITVTADAAVAPDGNTTAERLQIPATAAGQQSLLYQVANSGSATAHTASWFVRGNGTSGTTEICIFTGAGQTCAACLFFSTAWTRCSVTATISAGGTARIELGNQTLNSGVARNAADIFAWGAVMEEGAFASSYIATAGAAVARAAETADFTMPASVFDARGSAAASAYLADSQNGGLLAWGTNNRMLYVGASQTRMFDSTNVVSTANGTYPNSTTNRFWSSWSGSSMTVTNATQALTASGSFDGSMQALTTLQVGYNPSGAGPLWGVIKQVCLDPNPSRCR